MTSFHDIYNHMTSFAYRVKLSQERIDRIRLAVAKDQFDGARHLPRTGRWQRRRRQQQMQCWDELWADAEVALGA